jgi:hypothetical protein
MREFKFLSNNTLYTPLFEGMDIVDVFPLMYNPESFEPQRGVIFIYPDGSHYRITISTDHPQWNELRERYP